LRGWGKMKMSIKKKIAFLAAAFTIIELFLAAGVKSSFEDVGKAPPIITHIGPIKIPMGGFNPITVIVSWGIMALLVVWAVAVRKYIKKVPGRLQAFSEMFVSAFDSLCRDTLGDKMGRKYMPFITTIFLFVWLSNLIGIVPGVHEPTRDYNTCGGLALLVFLVAHISAIRTRGLKDYIAEYFEPMLVIKGVKIPNIIMFPLNLIGEVSKIISHSFRLFGNIFGGAVIIVIVSQLLRFVIVPIPLALFFGLFVGTVQAFVFTMLAVTYIAVLQPEEESA